MAQKPLHGHGILIVGTSRSHIDTAHSVGLLWTSDRPVAETNAWQHTTLMSSAEFESEIPARERPQTHALDRTATESAEVKINQKLNARIMTSTSM